MPLTFGLDIGTTSIGFAVIDHDVEAATGKTRRLGVRIFPEARDPRGTPLNQDRRQARLRRRQLRRKRERREDAGTYAAALVWLYVSQKLATDHTPNNNLCMSIEVRYAKAFIAPRKNSQRMSNLEAACKGIAALWGEI